MKTEVVVTLQVEGFHCWPEAPMEDGVMFLRNIHRHIFHIRATKKVEHGDRQIEIITLKRLIEKRIASAYGMPAAFGRLSCEHIAEFLQAQFELSSCEVLEDGENGAIVTA